MIPEGVFTASKSTRKSIVVFIERNPHVYWQIARLPVEALGGPSLMPKTRGGEPYCGKDII